MRAGRFVAAVAGLVLLAVLGAAVVRQTALAADPSLVWAVPLWHDLTAAGSSWTAAAAAVFAGLAAVLLVIAVRMALPAAPPVVEFGAGDTSTRVDAATLQSMLARRLGRAVPGLAVERAWLRDGPAGWCLWVRGDVPRADLEVVRRRAAVAAAEELRRVGGLSLARLDLEVRHVGVGTGGGR